MSKYVLINIGDFDDIVLALKKRSVNAISASDTLAEARKIKESVEIVSKSNFEPTEKMPEFKSGYRIITIKEV